MMRIAVIDDEPLARRAVMARLAASSEFDAVVEYTDGHSALDGLRADPVDLVFLDIEMPGLSGLVMLAELPVERRPLAILLTAHESFGLRAFELGVVDYLLKPIDPQRFDEALMRARDRWQWRQSALDAASTVTAWPARFAVRIGRSERFVATGDIRWIEADGDYATLHTADRAHLLRQALHQLSAQLDSSRFVRVHRSAIVRVDCVAELKHLTNRDALVRLDDGTPVRVSRRYIDDLLVALNRRQA